MFKKVLTLGMTLIVAISMLVGCTSNQNDKVTLKMSIATSEQSSCSQAAYKFAEIVSEKTNGEVEVKVFPNEQLSSGNQTKGLEMLTSGGVDVSFYSNIIYSALDERFSVLSLPWLFEDEEEVQEKLKGEAGDKINEMLENIGVVGLGITGNGFRQLTTTKKAVKSPEDIKGLKIRVPGMKMYVSLFQSLGADPITMNFSEVFTSLQQGAIDGQENPVDIISANKLYEVQDNISMWDYSYDGIILGMNKAKFDSLTPQQQTAIKEASTEACEYQRALLKSNTEEQLKAFKDKGMNIIEKDDIDIDAFSNLAEKTYTEYESKLGKDLIDAFK